MEITVQHWVILIGVVLILAILQDVYRRMHRDRGEKIRVSLVKVPGEPEEADELLSAHELPSGGARVVERGDLFFEETSKTSQISTEFGNEVDCEISSKNESVADSLEAAVESSAPQAAKQIVYDDADTQQSRPTNVAPQPHEVVMIHVTANQDEGFLGQNILQILLACDLRFGQSCFFHRHEGANGRGAIQFSVANMVTPGQFMIDAMDGFQTPGLTFFLALPGPDNMMQAFDFMLETAQCVADNLDGTLLDESRSILTQQTTEHSRQRIRDLERKLLALR
ncbi:MAG: cell division protein ZipA [Halieaceae bacterium]|jgi:cell division protein ZipA